MKEIAQAATTATGILAILLGLALILFPAIGLGLLEILLPIGSLAIGISKL